MLASTLAGVESERSSNDLNARDGAMFAPEA
jgi:hypothetical protein